MIEPERSLKTFLEQKGLWKIIQRAFRDPTDPISSRTDLF